MSKTIKVTQEDIDKATPASCCYCPIARALRRAFPRRRVAVGPIFITVGRERAYPPVKACEFITAFDSGRTVKPFSFKLDLFPSQP